MSEAPAPSFGELQRLLRRRTPAAGERCDYCAEPIGDGHAHLIDLKARRIMCACRPCAIVFEPEGAAKGRYKKIPTSVRALATPLDDGRWDALQIPIGLAFFFWNSEEQRIVGCYPGAGGAVESALPLGDWESLVGTDPQIAPDVEAVLVRRERDGRFCAYVVPIDVAYELVGIVRSGWRGFDGGSEVGERIEGYFARLAERAGSAVER
ncbi:MAG: DUF5947 family protein [Vulcanimicrobiaceae bacterium]